jgi:putative ABC transport system permease protein
VLNGFFVATWALVAVAVLVAVIGIVNSELATVLDRRMEITMLRTIGFRASHLVRAVMLECAGLGALGGAAGLALGTMLSAQFVDVALRLITGWRIPFRLHLGVPIVTVLFATAIAAVAGWVPARAAARLGNERESLE